MSVREKKKDGEEIVGMKLAASVKGKRGRGEVVLEPQTFPSWHFK